MIEMETILRHLKSKGFSPKVMIDCGAYIGDWTRAAKTVFPDSYVLMIEPQEDKKVYLEKVCIDYRPTVDYELALLGPENNSKIEFYEMAAGSSILQELSNVPRKMKILPLMTMDSILKKRNIGTVSILKIDVQGYELEVMKGASKTLQNTEAVILEVSLIQYNRGAPLFDEVIFFMKERGFLIYDIIDLLRWKDGLSWKDGTLFQANAIFVKFDSPLRQIDFIY